MLPLMKFCKIWQTGGISLLLVSQGDYKASFFQSSKRQIAKIEKTALTTSSFFVCKIHFLLDEMCCDNFGRFHQSKFTKITNKAKKQH